MKTGFAFSVAVAASLLLLTPAEARTKKTSSNGVKLVCQNKSYGQRAGCTLSNSTRKTKRCKYSIYYSWNPGSGTKYETKKGTATVTAKRTVWVLKGYGWRYRWSSLLLRCK